MNIRASVYYATRQKKWVAEIIFGVLEDGRRIKKYFRCLTKEDAEQSLDEYKKNLTEEEFYSTKAVISKAMLDKRERECDKKGFDASEQFTYYDKESCRWRAVLVIGRNEKGNKKRKYFDSPTKKEALLRLEEFKRTGVRQDLRGKTTRKKDGAVYCSNSKGHWVASIGLGKKENGVYKTKRLSAPTEELAIKRLEEFKKEFFGKEFVVDKIETVKTAGTNDSNNSVCIDHAELIQKSDRLEQLIELTKSTADSLLKISQEVYILRGELENIRSGNASRNNGVGFVDNGTALPQKPLKQLKSIKAVKTAQAIEPLEQVPGVKIKETISV